MSCDTCGIDFDGSQLFYGWEADAWNSEQEEHYTAWRWHCEDCKLDEKYDKIRGNNGK